MPFYKENMDNWRLGRSGVGYGKDIGKTDPSVKGAKPIKKPKEKVESIIIKKGITTKKDISNLKDFDKQKKKILKKIEEHNDYEEELIQENENLIGYIVELEDKIDDEEEKGMTGKVKNEEGITTQKELDGLMKGKNSVLSGQQEDLANWDKESYLLDKKLKKIESDIENLSKLIEGKINRQKDNEILNKVIKKEKNEIKKLEKELEQLFNKSKNKKLNVGKLNTILNEIQYINRAIERKSKIFKLAKPRPIGSVAQPTIKSATASIKFNETVEDPRLIKALKRLEVLKNKPKSIIISTLIKEQQFIIRRFREAMRIRGLMIKLK